MNRRITQQDIADRLKMHKSTVSLALRDNPGIALATRKRVQAMGREMGYRPDPALATLARQRWAGHETGSGSTLAFLIDSRMDNAFMHRRFLPAARERAEARGYVLCEFDLADYPSMKAVSRVLTARGIRGILVPQFGNSTGPSILDLPNDNFTVVGLDLGWISIPYHIVAPDMFEATRFTWQKVAERGYQRIGGAILSHTPRAVDDATRFGASVDFQQQHIPEPNRLPLLTSDIADQASFVRWLDRHNPDAVIGFVSHLLTWITETGRRVPEDVAFASLAARPDSKIEISGVVRHVSGIGSTGVDALIAAINENEWGVPKLQRKLLLEPIWNEGSTLPLGPKPS